MVISDSEMQNAIDRWCVVCDPVEISAMSAFYVFTGVRSRICEDHHSSYDWVLNDYSGSRIKLLLGPHYKTIIKAWCIKHQVDIRNAV